MTGDSIIYNFASIDSVAGSINSFVTQMNNDLGEVDKTFKDLLANGWQGAGADAFTGCSAKWHQNANQMAETLQRLSQKVGNAAVNMQQADQAAAAKF
jgi:WXG100 family type VII secretion target